MATREVHERDCVDILGKPFTEVHKWLDEYVKQYPVTIFEDQHRKFRHNKNGVEEVRKMWGCVAASAAILHIVRDEFGEITAKNCKRWDEENGTALKVLKFGEVVE